MPNRFQCLIWWAYVGLAFEEIYLSMREVSKYVIAHVQFAMNYTKIITVDVNGNLQ
jgi:hypothetical protein